MEASARTPLVGQDLDELTDLVGSLGEPRYRARQIYQGLYRDQTGSVAEISTLPLALRDSLERGYHAGQPLVHSRFSSSDGTVRYLLRLADDRTVEAVFIPEVDRDTLCISSQVGCAVDCKFCLTALMGLERNLTAGEIVGQVLTISKEQGLDAKRRPINIVMMGMGEPLLNLSSVMKATRFTSGPQWRRHPAAQDHCLDLGHRTQDRGVRKVRSPRQARHLVERFQSAATVGADADYVQVQARRPIAGVP